MFANISWNTYMLFMTLLTAAWYFIVLLRFYGKDLLAHISGDKRSFSAKLTAQASDSGAVTDSIAVAEDIHSPKHEDKLIPKDLSILIEELSLKINDTVYSAALSKYNTADFIALMQLTLTEYTELNTPSFRSKI